MFCLQELCLNQLIFYFHTLHARPHLISVEPKDLFEGTAKIISKCPSWEWMFEELGPKISPCGHFCTEIIRSRCLTDVLCEQEIILRTLGGVLALCIIVDVGFYTQCIKEIMLSEVKVLHTFLLRFRN